MCLAPEFLALREGTGDSGDELHGIAWGNQHGASGHHVPVVVSGPVSIVLEL